MTGAPATPPDPLAIQVARLDERTLALQRTVDQIQLTMATKAELRAWASVIVLLLGTVLAVVLRQHGAG